MSSDSSPLISVVLCSYNGARYLREQVDSILDQRDVQLELIAVDDASTDDSWAMLQAYASRDGRVRAFRNPTNLGYVANFERAAALAQGEYVAFADQDDVWLPHKLRVLLDGIGACSAIYSDAELIDEHGAPIGMRASNRFRMYRGADPLAFVFANCVSGHALMVRREVLTQALPFPRFRFHDWWLAAVAASLDGLEYLDEPLVKFRQHAASQTDMSRRKAVPTVDKNRRTAFLLQQAWLRELARVPGRHQARMRKLSGWWDGLEARRFSARLLAFLWRHRAVLFFIVDSRAARRLEDVVKLSIGQRLWACWRPADFAPEQG